MSEFQTSLLVIGALAVAAVFGYNKWQEYRAGRAADESFKSRHPDILVGEKGEPPAGRRDSTEDESRIEPVLSPHAPVAVSSAAKEVAGSAIPDARVDYVIEMSADAMVDAASLSECWAGVEKRFARRANLLGLVDGQWVAVPLAERYVAGGAAIPGVARGVGGR